jgi:DNA-directed RNA polymerase II subunit RPB1
MLMDSILLGGIPGVSSVNIRDIDMWDDKTRSVRPVPVIEAMGGNLLRFASMPLLDFNKCWSNDIHEVHDILGLEAAVSVLFNEIFTTISFDGTYVDPRHIMMIVNTMTYRGFIMPLSRHGINRMDTSPLVRCSFEETIDVLYDAAMYAEKDDAHGVTQNVMTGQTAHLGTGCFDVSEILQTVVNVENPKKKLVKSKVTTRSINREENSMEYIDRNLWSWEGPRHNVRMELPFIETRVEQSEKQKIFTTTDCQLPYTDDDREKDGNLPDPERVASVQQAAPEYYRPSSPCFD